MNLEINIEHRQEIYSKPMNDGTIPSEDDVCRMIINKSTTSNKAFDKKVGVNDD